MNFVCNQADLKKFQFLRQMQNREDEIAKNGIFSRRGYGGKRKSKSTIDEAGLFRKMNKKKSRIDERWVCGFDIYSYFLK